MMASELKRVGFRPLVLGTLGLALTLGILPACSAQEKSVKDKASKTDSAQVLATVNGQPVTAGDVQSKSSESFQQLDRDYQNNRHTLLETQLKALVQDRLLDAEAASRKVSKDQLLTEIKAPDVSDAEVHDFYEKNKAQIPRPEADVAAQIKQYLGQQGQAAAREKYFANLEAKYKVEYKMEPLRVEVASAGHPTRGNAKAPVTIVEFSDFQCPFCSRLNPTIEQVMAKYGDKVRLVFRQYPLPMHQNAEKAAEAALCANEQGKFWEMHDAMFKDQSALAVDALKTKAAAIGGLNAANFNACLDNGKQADAVRADMKDGSAAGVSGTPAMFVNGRFINGAVPIEQITTVIDDELKRTKS